MSPLDMLIFLFFILVSIKAASSCIDYWKDFDDEAEVSVKPQRPATSASLSRTVRTGRPSSVRVTPIKREKMPAVVAADHQYNLKDKGAA